MGYIILAITLTSLLVYGAVAEYNMRRSPDNKIPPQRMNLTYAILTFFFCGLILLLAYHG